MSNKNGGPAFPLPEAAHPGAFPPDVAKGMTLRDYFAAKAMQGIISSGDADFGTEIDEMAQGSYAMADAMLKAREVGNE